MGLDLLSTHDPRLSFEENLKRLRAELNRRRRVRAEALRAVVIAAVILLTAIVFAIILRLSP